MTAQEKAKLKKAIQWLKRDDGWDEGMKLINELLGKGPTLRDVIDSFPTSTYEEIGRREE